MKSEIKEEISEMWHIMTRKVKVLFFIELNYSAGFACVWKKVMSRNYRWSGSGRCLEITEIARGDKELFLLLSCEIFWNLSMTHQGQARLICLLPWLKFASSEGTSQALDCFQGYKLLHVRTWDNCTSTCHASLFPPSVLSSLFLR